MKTFRSWICVLVLAGAIAPASLAHAEGPPPGASEEEQHAYWTSRHHDLVERVRDANARLEAARDTYRHGIHRPRRDEARKTELQRAIAEAEAGLGEARRALDELPEEARRAGALPGWIREMEEVPSPSTLEQALVESATTPEDHAALAQKYRDRAARRRAQAEAHHAMGLAYAGTRISTPEQMRQHCEKMASLESQLADEYERLAAVHEAQSGP
jgi:hypothetical protein